MALPGVNLPVDHDNMNVQIASRRDNDSVPAVSRLRRSADKTTISVLHVGKYFPPFAGGMEHFLADLLPTMAANGVKTAALVHDHRPSLRGRGPETICVAPRGDAAPETRHSYVLYRAPAFGRLVYAPVSPWFLAWLKRAILVERPDILHLHLPNTSAFWALCVREARRLPWVIHWHSDVVPSRYARGLKLLYPGYRPFENKLLSAARTIIVTSPPYLESSRALRPWRDKCRVVPLGFDAVRITGPTDDGLRVAEQWWAQAKFRLLCIGRLTYYKGQEHLIRALRHVIGVRLLIVGAGEQRRRLAGIIAELQLADRAVLAGELTHLDLHALIETCHCLCLPSMERTEAFGMVLLEAMAHKKPVVACDVPGSGMAWVVQDGKTGRIVPPGDSEALATVLQTFSSDHNTMAAMGYAGWLRYRQLFGIDVIGQQIREVYDEAIVGGAQ